MRFWIPWLRSVYDWMKMLGICPYYYEKRGEHLIPIVPEMDLGTISVYVNKKHKIKFKWRWTHGDKQREEDTRMQWILGDHPPTKVSKKLSLRFSSHLSFCCFLIFCFLLIFSFSQDGKIRSSLGALLPEYRTLLIIQRALEISSAQNSELTHILEYHPQVRIVVSSNVI